MSYAYAVHRRRFKNMFGGPAAPAIPPPLPPPPMPDPYSAATMEARRKAATDMMSAQGRQSTILSTSQSRAAAPAASGASDYAGKTLGGGG